ncbi:MAG: hypothetical protein SGJ27_02535 [Candidatus Melainabacteria bacterium]|nr:hypothetical protein [Candidatus Melainabacteria bacterium]
MLIGKLIGGAAVVLAVAMAQGAAQAQESGWALTQKSSAMGDLYTYVSPSGLKWTVPKVGANIATMGPSWSVTMYNDKTHLYYSTTFAEWQKTISRRDARTAEMKSRPWQLAGAGNVAGLRATKYTMKNAAPVAGGGRNLNAVASAECWVATDIAVPPSVSDMLSNTYGMPKTKYFPLRITYTGPDGRLVTALDTYKSEARQIPANYFGLPGGYKLASSQAEVFMDDETQRMMNDMASEMGMDAPRRPQQHARPAAVPNRGGGVALRTPPPQQGNDLSKMLDALKGGK